jgi:hypothetical protein
MKGFIKEIKKRASLPNAYGTIKDTISSTYANKVKIPSMQKKLAEKLADKKTNEYFKNKYGNDLSPEEVRRSQNYADTKGNFNPFASHPRVTDYFKTKAKNKKEIYKNIKYK